MNKEIIEKWEKNKRKLKRYLSTHSQDNYDTYLKLFKLIVKYILNSEEEEDEYSSENIVQINDGGYQGTKIFLIPKDTVQPDVNEYLYTYVWYGSCSGCDTLLSISAHKEGRPNIKQVKSYMTLCLHMIQRMKFLEE